MTKFSSFFSIALLASALSLSIAVNAREPDEGARREDRREDRREHRREDRREERRGHVREDRQENPGADQGNRQETPSHDRVENHRGREHAERDENAGESQDTGAAKASRESNRGPGVGDGEHADRSGRDSHDADNERSHGRDASEHARHDADVPPAS